MPDAISGFTRCSIEEAAMFTGIIQEIGVVAGVVRRAGGIVLSVRAPGSAKELKVDDSVAVNGVCQTVVRCGGDTFEVEAVEETLRKTTLGSLNHGAMVNLELALRVGDRLGGHLVQGHVDCVGEIVAVEKRPMSWMVMVGFPEAFSRYLIPVGSIAVDGISLTVAAVENGRFTVSVIPHTLEKTTLADVAAGRNVNLEFDLVGKYIERLTAGRPGGGGAITVEKLSGWGF
jgi:riboflavin synthase